MIQQSFHAIARQSRTCLPAYRARTSPLLASLRCAQQLRFNTNVAATTPPQKQRLGKVEPKLQMTMTCTAYECNHRSTHEFSRLAYERGIVLVQCPSCQTRHLVADHLGWFDSDDLTQGGKYKTIEELLKSKGEKVERGQVFVEGSS